MKILMDEYDKDDEDENSQHESFSDYEYNHGEDSNSDIYEGELNICLYFFQFFL